MKLPAFSAGHIKMNCNYGCYALSAQGEILLFHELFAHGQGINHHRTTEVPLVQELFQLSDFCLLHLLQAYRKC